MTSAVTVTCVRGGHWLGSDFRLSSARVQEAHNYKLTQELGWEVEGRQAEPGSVPKKGLSGSLTGGKAALCVHKYCLVPSFLPKEVLISLMV